MRRYLSTPIGPPSNLYSPAKKPGIGVWIGLGTAALAGIVVFGLLAQACGDKAIPGASDRLKRFESDPVTKFRAPGTKLVKHSKESGVQRWNNEQTQTRLDQAFAMKGDPADTVEAYRTVAEAAGWGRVFESCSRAEQATGRAYTKLVDGQSSTLSIRAELGTSPASTRHKPTLTVSIVAGGQTTVVTESKRRNDLRCLTGLDPSSPDLAVPELDRVTSEAVCAAVNLDGISGVAEVAPTEDHGDGYAAGCTFYGGMGVGSLLEVTEATEPLAYYQDMALEDPAPGQPFRFADYEPGIWLRGLTGSFVVRSRYSSSAEYGLSPARLLQVAHDAARV